MDKIQTAIAKARAARNEAAGAISNETRPSHAALQWAGARMRASEAQTPASSYGRAAVWQPLATFAPSAKLMAKRRIVTFEAGSQKAIGVVAFDMLRTKILQQISGITQVNGVEMMESMMIKMVMWMISMDGTC